ncbi:GntR family transcriptional regulator [Streptomyces sp. ISL-12]|uniref:GntR family transcriptional regulator n=1 Tax=Streptomyces sp. ISL-12 TaxID=2819177 RepID=UPI001BECF977|nr:GntR family transcriptional regulator [Streptomyces sp. ISL-12]MBT2412068.1 GntR family transcriptional regulator [Streptomyces sp. ISL-12]
MTKPALTAASATAGSAESRYRELRSALHSFHRMSARFTGKTPTGLAQDREAVWAAVDPWLPLAQQRLSEAERSPSDQARWRTIIQEASRPATKADMLPQPDMVLLVSAARRLLRTLMEAERPGPTVHEIAERARRAIRDGDYPSGSTLPLRRLAQDTAATTPERVELALLDLQDEGLVTVSHSRRTRVTVNAVHQSRPEQIAAWLRFLVRSGVYPPGTALPGLQTLARSLVSSTPDVVSALRLLADEDVLVARQGRRCAVRTVLPFPVAEPPRLDGLARKLRDRATPGPPPTDDTVLAACRQTHAWWSSRAIPPRREVDVHVATLITACAGLVDQASTRPFGHRDMQALLRQTAVTALTEQPTDEWERTWRSACLGALVRDLHLLHTAPLPQLQDPAATPQVTADLRAGHQLGPST